MYVLKRTDQGGGYVAPAGSSGSYTPKLQNARTFYTYAEADKERCPGNEIIVPASEEMRG